MGCKREIVLVDPETTETFKVFVNVQDFVRMENDPSYQQKILNQVKKARNASSCLNSNKTNKENNLVELTLIDALNQIHILKISAETRDRALKDLSFATKLLNEHLAALGSSCTASECKMNTAVLKEGTCDVFELTLIEQSTMESFTLYVDQKTFNRAQTDISFATQLLNNHRAAINEQNSNTLSTDIEKNDIDIGKNDNNIDISQNSSDELQKLIGVYENDDYENVGTSSKCALNKSTGRYVWHHPEILLLIHLYKEYDTAYSDGKLTHKQLWKKITDGMFFKGYDISTSQCISKMDSLKRAYKSVKDHNSQSGNDKKRCTFYEELDELFQKKPWIKPLSTAGSNMPLENLDNLDNKKSVANTCKQSKVQLEAHKINYLEESLEIKRLKRTDTEHYRNKKLAIMQDLIETLKK